MLINWRTEFKPPKAGAVTKWQFSATGPDGPWTDCAGSADVEKYESRSGVSGTFEIVYVRGGKQSKSRKMKVVESEVVVFTGKVTGKYKKKGWIAEADTTAIVFIGQVKKKAGPETKKIKWGFIQRVETKATVKHEYHAVNPIPPGGAKVSVPDWFKLPNIPGDPPHVDTKHKGDQLYQYGKVGDAASIKRKDLWDLEAICKSGRSATIGGTRGCGKEG